MWAWCRRLNKHITLPRRRIVKLNAAKIRWILREKRKGELTNSQIAEAMHVSARWVRKIWARYRNHAGPIQEPARTGRPKNGMPGRREHSSVLAAQARAPFGAAALAGQIDSDCGLNIPHGIIHKILRDEGIARRQPKKSQRRSWVRYERKWSNSLWHTDWKVLPDGRHLLCYLDGNRLG